MALFCVNSGDTGTNGSSFFEHMSLFMSRWYLFSVSADESEWCQRVTVNVLSIINWNMFYKRTVAAGGVL